MKNSELQPSQMQTLQQSSYLDAGNAEYLEDLYEQYLQDPQKVSQEWRNYFNQLQRNTTDLSHKAIKNYFRELARQSSNYKPVRTGTETYYEAKQLQVTELIDAYRKYGHYHAQLDPLGLAGQRPIHDLELKYHDLSDADLDSSFLIDGSLGIQSATLSEILTLLKQTYCGTIGIEYEHIADTVQIDWIRNRFESVRGHPTFSKEQKIRILQRLTEAEGLERYFGSKYVGQTRFSLEGGDSLMPLLDELIQRAVTYKTKELVVGMGHRGRLNVLINALGKSLTEISDAFEGKHEFAEGSGDVKYHLGFSSDIPGKDGNVHVTLAFNPSHLEIIDPVVEGSVRARQQRRNDVAQSQIIPVLIHGDAAFAGQGVVMETLNLSRTRGYSTGGTVHIVINNQVGFTISNPHDARSTWYCTDVAKMIEAPIMHVNGDDPEAVVFAAQLALDFRAQFKKDVVIDLVCYRRLGHNEGDEPSATQPLMYRLIKQHATTRQIYADKLIAENVITKEDAENMITKYRELLDKGHEIISVKKDTNQMYLANWLPYLDQKWTAPAKTSVPLPRLKKIANQIETMPKDFVLQAQVAKMYEDRRKMTAGELPINWGYAEALAFATLLDEDYGVRLSGQDSGRGTFAHRHAVLHDNQNGNVYIPLDHVSAKQAKFTVVDSILSEEAVVGFEYGYASSDPKTLVIWEAQYGDFVNGAQVVIDQFISSGEQKWARLSGITMFLPHGYEGAGPEHSSARLERFLQLCAEENMQVVVPTTPAQAFHVIRRQMVRPYRKPLIVLTPKSMLRNKLAVSSLNDLATGEFQVLLPEIEDLNPAEVSRVILCSGKVYYDLLEQRQANKQKNVAIIRIEQLYPFPAKQLTAELERYKKAKEVFWCQEEPQNQGSWFSIFHKLQADIAKWQVLSYVGRPSSASPATGSKQLHVEQQKKLINDALS